MGQPGPAPGIQSEQPQDSVENAEVGVVDQTPYHGHDHGGQNHRQEEESPPETARSDLTVEKESQCQTEQKFQDQGASRKDQCLSDGTIEKPVLQDAGVVAQ